MKSVRMWVGVLALTSFLAGVAGGMLFTLKRYPRHAPGPFAAYRTRLVEEYELSSFDDDRLGQILAAYTEEIERLKARQLQAFDAELVRAGRECSVRIADYVIPEDRKDEFRQACGIDPDQPFPPTVH